MSTAYIWNGFGDYDIQGDEVGITVKFGGRDFFLPYLKTTVFADRTLREVNHDASTASTGDRSELTYMSVSVKGDFIADYLTNHQVPTTHSDMGIMTIRGKATGNVISVNAGYDLDGSPITVEVTEREPTKPEREQAEANALLYKETMVADYFQSKRERMNGGTGRKTPDKRIRAYMEELGVIDNDDVTAHQKPVSNMDPEALRVILEMFQKTQEVTPVKLAEAVESVRKAGKAQVSSNKNGRRSLGLAEHKAKLEAEEAAKQPVGQE